MTRTITTEAELDALWDLGDVLVAATGDYANGDGGFVHCWARPVPEFVGGERGTWEVLVFGQPFSSSLTMSSLIRTATVLYPGQPTPPQLVTTSEALAAFGRIVNAPQVVEVVPYLADVRMVRAALQGDARVAATALREAANRLAADSNDRGDWWDDHEQRYTTPAEWLRARADEVENVLDS